jgi:aspartate carbamoyltransferase catalytic subunit
VELSARDHQPPVAPSLLGIEPLSKVEIVRFLDQAAAFKAKPPSPSLRDRLVVNLFFEASTRTRSSFEIAAKKLGAEVVNLSPAASSVTKGETLFDTARNVEAMRPAALVIRHASSGAPHAIAARIGCSVVNAGDGAHEHPSQALLDAFTLRERWGTLEGKTIAIVGDIAHSRVAGSNIRCLTRLGATVRLCGPPTMLPPGLEQLGEPGKVEVHLQLDAALRGADAAMMLRIQLERQDGPPLFPTLREYARLFGLGAHAVEALSRDAVVLHPGPVNRGVELSPAVADGPRSLILEQVENGVYVRMAILHLLLGASA